MQTSPANNAGSCIAPVGIKAAAFPTRNMAVTAKQQILIKTYLAAREAAISPKATGCFPAYPQFLNNIVLQFFDFRGIIVGHTQY
jgi:hypothetical protein